MCLLSDRQRAAVDRGADSLWQLIRFHYKKEPRALRQFHRAYVRLCCSFHQALERRTGAPLIREKQEGRER